MPEHAGNCDDSAVALLEHTGKECFDRVKVSQKINTEISVGGSLATLLHNARRT